MTARKKRGFALILSLSLMGLMVLLALTLSALIQIESGAADNQRNLALARQNALAGAYQAIGVLQQQLGPDQRVTARADITTSNAINPCWVGVWNTSTLSIGGSEQFSSAKLGASPQRWLVSGSTTSNPATALPSSTSVTLMSAVTASSGLIPAVTVPRVTITTSDRVGGGYAWWISDEGMKASAALDNTGRSVTVSSLSARRQLAPVRAGLEMVSSTSAVADDLNLTDEKLKQVGRLSTVGQLPYVDNSMFTATRAEALSHDLTAMSYGVLASTLTVSGTRTLKVDLTSASTSDAAASAVLGDSATGIRAFLTAYKTLVDYTDSYTGKTIKAFPLTTRTPSDSSPITGKAYFSIAPIFTEWYFAATMNFGSSSKGFPAVWPTNPVVTGVIQTRVTPYFEMWNPYTTPIVPKGGHMYLRLKNFPTFRFHFWYDANLNTSGPQWLANNLYHDGFSPFLNFNDKFGKVTGSDGYMAFHLINQKNSSGLLPTYDGGDMLHWFGMRPANVSSTNQSTTVPMEHVSGFGAHKESFYESDRGITRCYYQAFGGKAYAYFLNNYTWPLYPTTSNPVPTMTTTNSNVNYTCFTIEWSATQPQMEIYYVPEAENRADNSNQEGTLSSAVLLSTVKMPAPDASYDAPPSGSVIPTRYMLTNHQYQRWGFHYARVDGASSGGSSRLDNDWLFGSSSVDPRSYKQPDNIFEWGGGTEDPNLYYIDGSGGSGGDLIPKPYDTLTQMLDRKSGKLNNGASLASTDIEKYIQELGSSSSRPQLTTKGASSPAHRKPLFEIPTSIPISLGVLQNVLLENRQPYCIGNSRGRNAGISGANVNLIFDKAYLSGIENTDLASLDITKPMTNSNLTPLWTSSDSAPTLTEPGAMLGYFMSRGAFNVNSTSVDAWKALLSGGWIEDWEYDLQVGEDDMDAWKTSTQTMSVARRSFFRFAHTANEVFTAPDNASGMGKVEGKYYRRGIRRLTSEQIDVMARLIVAQIQKRGRPFSCMAEFLSASAPDGGSDNLSILEYAINPPSGDAYGSNPIYRWNTSTEMTEGADVSGSSSGNIDKGAPADLSQADILNTLAPVLQARSDTFKILSYGDVKDESGAVVAKATCEVTVQRYPEPVAASTVSATELASLYLNPQDGRQFKVVSIKWR